MDDFDRDQYEFTLGRRQDIFGERYVYSYIRFAGTVSVVPCVTSFDVQSGPRFLDPGSLVALTASFPNLERINWPYEDPSYFLALRRQQMQEFTSAVDSFQTPSACKTVYITINTPWYPHKERLPDLIPDDKAFCGALSVMLGRSNIQHFNYKGPIDPTLFWPRESPETNETSSWRCLHEMQIRFGMGSLMGQWFSDVPIPQDTAGLLPPGYYDNDDENERAIALAKSMEMPNDEEGFVVEGLRVSMLPARRGHPPLADCRGATARPHAVAPERLPGDDASAGQGGVVLFVPGAGRVERLG
ncbi:hypothetical protein SLS63_011140 [Diaporthe eres]|uniref:Uncharacterized protein n=1 Tax=Diaporthe eres TaxID=83184 RepID=A0ABR1NUY7_DIAER